MTDYRELEDKARSIGSKWALEVADAIERLTAELAEANRAIAETADVRDSWCAEYVKARDERDALAKELAGSVTESLK